MLDITILLTWPLSYIHTSSNNNHLSSHETNIIKKIKIKKIQKYRGLDQNDI